MTTLLAVCLWTHFKMEHMETTSYPYHPLPTPSSKSMLNLHLVTVIGNVQKTMTIFICMFCQWATDLWSYFFNLRIFKIFRKYTAGETIQTRKAMKLHKLQYFTLTEKCAKEVHSHFPENHLSLPILVSWTNETQQTQPESLIYS